MQTFNACEVRICAIHPVAKLHALRFGFAPPLDFALTETLL